MQPNNNHNILITSAGKRVELLLEFKRELKSKFPEARVYTVDLNPEMAPACRLSDGYFKVSRVTSPDYIDEILDICVRNGIYLIIPTIDPELAVFSKARDRFMSRGIEVMISDPYFISICRDKRKTIEFFNMHDIRYPALREKDNPIFPMFAKPYDGSLSTNTHILRGPEDMSPSILNDTKLIFMELVDKHDYKEYTVDIYFDTNGDMITIVPRERIEIRSGESNKAATRKNHIIDFLRSRLSHISGVRGCICIQLFFRESDNDIIGIEINPRFGGGYPLSYYAGANFPEMMIREYLQRQPLEFDEGWTGNTVMLRYDSQVIFHE